VRELREKSGAIWQRVELGEEFVVTRNGKPFALLVHTKPDEVEEQLRLLRAARFGAIVRSIQRDALASGASEITEEEIQAEIDAARREMAAAVPLAAEPAPPRYARRR
jgi:antitoxin (DNA-binding transcriptional repressor) of toxin-antitoxin stability system